MKKLLVQFAIAGIMVFGLSTITVAQDEGASSDSTQVEQESEPAAEAVTTPPAPAITTTTDSGDAAESESWQKVIKEKFIEGGITWMSPVLICLILGLAIAIERIITLNLATTNTKKLLASVEDALSSGGVEAAKEVTSNTRGPVASIFTQGLLRMSEGVEMVEKSIISYGSVEMGRLERGLVWVSLFIALAPMLGFTGTVIGMIQAFDDIQAAGDISPQIVAKGIKVALLTTVAGLFVGIILQVFYNYLVSKIDAIVNQMEDASISLVDILVKHKLSK
jgi:biopolymer transport protein ExbB